MAELQRLQRLQRPQRPRGPEAPRGLHLWKAKINFPKGTPSWEKIELAKSKVVQYLATVGGWGRR